MTSEEISKLQIFDAEAVMTRIDGDKDLLIELVALFFGELDSKYQQFEQAMKAKDSDALKFRAHALRSALGNLGAMRASARAFELENIGKSSLLDRADSVFKFMKSEIAEFKLQVEAFINQ